MSTSTDTPARPGKSRASTGAARAATDQPKLTVVPDPAPSPADIAAKLGKVLGAAPVQAAPAPSGLPDSVIKRAAQAGGTSRVTGEPAGQHGTKKGTTPRPVVVKATQSTAKTPKTPKAKTPKVKVAGPVTAAATAVTVDRYNGTVTVTTPAAGKTPASEKVHGCEHSARNGHITLAAANACAGRLLRNYTAPDGGTVTAGIQVRPRYWGAYQGTAEGSVQITCDCRFGHKTADAAVACAKTHAAAAGLNAG
jgi:hypothetical protein